jgi:uncharacterized membrane protein
MEPAFWSHAHGATTHFPIALVLCSGGADLAGFALAGRPVVRDLHAVGFWTILGGAAGAVPTVISGLVMTKGSLLGHGALRMHHLFVWPAFALITGLATWRLIVGRRATRPTFAAYLGCVGVAGLLIAAAGYWGGEVVTAS